MLWMWASAITGSCFGRQRPQRQRYNPSMAKNIIHISEAEAVRDFAGLLARVRAGGEIVIGDDARPVAVVRPAEPQVRLLSESLRLAKEHASTATLDADFARDLEEARSEEHTSELQSLRHLVCR